MNRLRLYLIPMVTLVACVTGAGTARGPVSDSGCREAIQVAADSTIDLAAKSPGGVKLITLKPPRFT